MCWYGGAGWRQNRHEKLPGRHSCENGPGFAQAEECPLAAPESHPGVPMPASARLGLLGPFLPHPPDAGGNWGRRSRKAETSAGRLLLSWLPGRLTAAHRHPPLPGGVRQVPYAPRRSDSARGRLPRVVLGIDRVPGACSAPARYQWAGDGDVCRDQSTARTGGGRFSTRVENLDGRATTTAALRAATRSRRAGHYPCGWGRSWGIAWVRLRIGARGPRSRSSTGRLPACDAPGALWRPQCRMGRAGC